MLHLKQIFNVILKITKTDKNRREESLQLRYVAFVSIVNDHLDAKQQLKVRLIQTILEFILNFLLETWGEKKKTTSSLLDQKILCSI